MDRERVAVAVFGHDGGARLFGIAGKHSQTFPWLVADPDDADVELAAGRYILRR